MDPETIKLAGPAACSHGQLDRGKREIGEGRYQVLVKKTRDPETIKLPWFGIEIYESLTPETIKLDPETKKLDPLEKKLERSGPDFGSIWGRLPVFFSGNLL